MVILMKITPLDIRVACESKLKTRENYRELLLRAAAQIEELQLALESTRRDLERATNPATPCSPSAPQAPPKAAKAPKPTKPGK